MRRRLFLLAFVLGLLVAGVAVFLTHRGDPDVLWKIVHGRCVPNQRANGKPAPCANVDLAAGKAGGHAILKDIVGASQYLLIPTARVEGMESPVLLEASTPNYFSAAWEARVWIENALRRPVARETVGLAINSHYARSQNQLHIHIDCLREDVIRSLARHAGELGSVWSKFPEQLAGEPYLARRLNEADLAARSPFRLLAEEVPGAAASMASYSLVLAGADFPDGQPGFVLLAGRFDLLALDFGHGEDLLDHACAVVR